MFVGVIGAGGFFVMGLPEEDRGDDGVETIGTAAPEPLPPEPPPPEPPPPEPVIASSEDAVRERAQERFLTSTQTLVRDLQPIPEVWLQGAYFALPSDYGEIRDIWESYLTIIREVRVADRDRYGAAYELALDDAAVQGEVRTTRLDAAVADFDADTEERDAHWDRVEALAVAAIQSHDALVEAEGLILHDATGAIGRSGGIGAGTSGRDTDAQLLLDQVVELMSRVLLGDGLGPGEGRNVREWVWGGFLDVVPN